MTPMTGISNGLIDVENRRGSDVSAEYQLVNSDYFRALNIPVLRGRTFDQRDHENAEHVVLVNRALAELAWPGQNPIGQRVTGGGMDDYWNQTKWATVIGVVGDIRQRDLTRKPQPTLYFSYRQRPFRAWSMTAVLRPSAGQASALTAQVRNAVRDLDRNVPVLFATIEERVSDTLAPRRFVLSVILAFALVALTLLRVAVNEGLDHYLVYAQFAGLGRSAPAAG